MKQRIDHLLEERLALFSEDSVVDAACLHAVRGGGRIRPRIIYTIASSLESRWPVEPAALCVEFLHCASLIADDLPCMDDDATRRGRPTCHIAFGQEVALLASYKLIAIAYHALSEAAPLLPLERHLIGLKLLSRRSAQMIDGQLNDLRSKVDKSAPKTTALFQAAFSLGWIYSGGALHKLDSVEKAAFLFGDAFQMADDLSDGGPKTSRDFSETLFQAKEELKKIGLLTLEMADLISNIENSYSVAGSS